MSGSRISASPAFGGTRRNNTFGTEIIYESSKLFNKKSRVINAEISLPGMPKIKLELEKCIGCGSCSAICPKYFEMADDGKVHIKGAVKQPASPSQGGDVEELEIEKIECAESAAEACPVQCIHIIK